MLTKEKNFKLQITNYKFFVATVLLLLFSSFITYYISLIHAQTPLDSSKANYLAQLTRYNNSYDAYITAKSSYLAFKTAVSKTTAFEKTKDYLLQVDQLYITYLQLIKENGNNARWQNTSFNKAETEKIIADEFSFMQSFQDRLPTAQTLEDLPPLSIELKTHIENSTVPRANKIYSTYNIVQTESAFFKFKDISTKLSSAAQKKIRPENNALFLNWQTEIKDIETKTADYISQAKKNYENVPESGDNQRDLNQTYDLTQKAKEELKRSKNLFSEMLKIL